MVNFLLENIGPKKVVAIARMQPGTKGRGRKIPRGKLEASRNNGEKSGSVRVQSEIEVSR